MSSAQVADASSINFILPGIIKLLTDHELRVPVYQRSYSWQQDDQVEDFWSDLERSFDSKGEYFLGTVVLAKDGNEGKRTIIDGQQRLATVSLLLAAIRDEFANRGSDNQQVVQNDYLAKKTLTSDGPEPRLELNPDDDEYFNKFVTGKDIEPPIQGGKPQFARTSHKLLYEAYKYLAGKVRTNADAAGSAATERLSQWVMFLHNRARIGVIEVASEADAYVIFETLNNRGADLTTADLLKNYLYGRAGNKLDTVRHRWIQALSTLELTAADRKFTAFLRNYWSSYHGLTREKDLYKAIRDDVSNATKAVKLSGDIAEAASHYAALDNPSHDSWGTQLGSAGETNIALLADFDLSPNKPLMLAALKLFPSEEIRNLLRALVSWSVRGMILNTMNAGSVEKEYCRVAVEIRRGQISTVEKVRDELDKVIPSDHEFRSAFEIAQVKRNKTARYYLRALERGYAGKPEPELVPNPDESQINLEHVLPKNAKSEEWPLFKSEERPEFDDIDTWAYLLGNMVLLQKTKNSKIGNRSFAEKKETLLESEFALTKEVGSLQEWTPEAITKRQEGLAKLAVKVWPR
ncbi:DUF262 domain-containing protein [Actinomadura sp. HBU206391]|uniref:DUF262 domain-containing protein n=1 Tax=Actinomadura sp. HBU206391 TaxID=2731692 RepID=UPI00164F2B6D|nr:DUF262 domain-containing protein [Actinomadura sp. HBU206391]MBC6456617.1 DUF262 domain-containing protein [Actinomadura sp. HBU206391]